MDAHQREMQDRRFPFEEDIAQQRRIWRFERVGWYVLLAIVLLTLLGAFSHGLFSSVTASSGQKDLMVEYERFHRSGAVNAMVIHTHGQPGKTHTLTFGKSLLEGFSIESIQPQPVSSTGTRQGLNLTFSADEHGDSTLYLAWRSEGLGLIPGDIALEGGGRISITQFIYP